MKPSIIDVLEAIHKEDTHAKMRFLQSINETRPHPDSQEFAEEDDELDEEGAEERVVKAAKLGLMEKRKAARVKRFARVRNLCKSFESKSLDMYMTQVITQLAL